MASPRVKKDPELQLKIENEMNIYQAATLSTLFLDALSKNRPIAIDLSGVMEIDTSGLQLLLVWAREARQGERPIRFLNPGPAIREALAFCRLESLLDVPSSTLLTH